MYYYNVIAKKSTRNNETRKKSKINNHNDTIDIGFSLLE